MAINRRYKEEKKRKIRQFNSVLQNIVEPNFSNYDDSKVRKILEDKINERLKQVHHSMEAKNMTPEDAKGIFRDYYNTIEEMTRNEFDSIINEKISSTSKPSLKSVANAIDRIENSAHMDLNQIVETANIAVDNIVTSEKIVNPNSKQSKPDILFSYGFVEGTMKNPPVNRHITNEINDKIRELRGANNA